MFRSAGCSLLKADGLSWILDLLYWGLRISKLPFLIKKISNFYPPYVFFNFGHQILDPDWIQIRIDIQPKMLDPESIKSGSETQVESHNDK